jgi:hypothetical protein
MLVLDRQVPHDAMMIGGRDVATLWQMLRWAPRSMLWCSKLCWCWSMRLYIPQGVDPPLTAAVQQKLNAEASKCLLGDKAYDSVEFRQWLRDRGTKPVIPNRSNRKPPFRFSKRFYRERDRIEDAFSD